MSDINDPDTNQVDDDAPEVPEVYGPDDVDAVGLPDQDFLGMSPGTANEETDPDEPPVPDQA